MLKEILISMRPKQWYKNLVIFIGIAFSLNLLNINLWITVISAFIIFCLLSGSIYLINDVLDIEKDRKHPKKSKRPIASGSLKTYQAILFATIFIILSFFWSYTINLSFFAISAAFFILMMVYSLYLKQYIIVDILTISTGFVMRAIAGALAISVLVSPWLIICTFLLALFLALGKRRHELILLGDEAQKHRQSLDGYSTNILDQMIIITISTLIMSYSLYTFFSNNELMMLTIPFAFYGIFRYLYLIHSEKVGGEPEMLFKDKGMLISIILWTLIVISVLYLKTDLGSLFFFT
ncbi:MAG: decaprenyl-phosphate phosphoribosyltransferase [Methanobacterium sp.]|nr:decaprenyl-phosphate phosphoribosyltransferase [Methanobacterium sp.]